jgi:hypothetical protein
MSSALLSCLLGMQPATLVPVNGGDLRGEGADCAGPDASVPVGATVLGTHCRRARRCPSATGCYLSATRGLGLGAAVGLLLDWTLRRWALAGPGGRGGRGCRHSGLEAVRTHL